MMMTRQNPPREPKDISINLVQHQGSLASDHNLIFNIGFLVHSINKLDDVYWEFIPEYLYNFRKGFITAYEYTVEWQKSQKTNI